MFKHNTDFPLFFFEHINTFSFMKFFYNELKGYKGNFYL